MSVVVVTPKAATLKKVEDVVDVQENSRAVIEEQSEDSNTSFTNPTVFNIFSPLPLDDIVDAVKPYGEIFHMRVVKRFLPTNNRLVDSNLTIAVMLPETYQKLCAAGYRHVAKTERTETKVRREHNLRIAPRTFSISTLPDLQKVHNDIHIIVPTALQREGSALTEALTNILSQLERAGTLPANSYNLSSSYASRLGAGTIRKFQLNFKAEVSDQVRTAVKYVLNDSNWPIFFEDTDDQPIYTIKCDFRHRVTEAPTRNRAPRENEFRTVISRKKNQSPPPTSRAYTKPSAPRATAPATAEAEIPAPRVNGWAKQPAAK